MRVMKRAASVPSAAVPRGCYDIEACVKPPPAVAGPAVAVIINIIPMLSLLMPTLRGEPSCGDVYSCT